MRVERETGADGVDARMSKLGGEDSNPQQMDQNHPCYQLHHPRRAKKRYRLNGGGYQTTADGESDVNAKRLIGDNR